MEEVGTRVIERADGQIDTSGAMREDQVEGNNRVTIDQLGSLRDMSSKGAIEAERHMHRSRDDLRPTIGTMRESKKGEQLIDRRIRRCIGAKEHHLVFAGK